jgi:hypothetical protein
MDTSSTPFMERLKTHFSKVQELTIERKGKTEPDCVHFCSEIVIYRTAMIVTFKLNHLAKERD